MLVKLREDAGEERIASVRGLIEAAGGRTVLSDETTLVVTEGRQEWMSTLVQLPHVAAVTLLTTPYKLVARAVRESGTVVDVGGVAIGGDAFVVAAGPCAVETPAQMETVARGVARAGAALLRGGAFKPRTSPYAFQGHGENGLRLLAEAGRSAGLPVVTEVMTAEDVPLVARWADMLQVGARNAQNFSLLKALGRVSKPVLLKRGLAVTVEEMLLSAEYIVAHGNPNVVLCERGIRTFETSTRNTLDLNSVALLKRLTHLPVLVDPSHGTGRRELVGPLAKAAAAAGADGILVEVHPTPDAAWSDSAQSLDLSGFERLMGDLMTRVVLDGRSITVPPSPTPDSESSEPLAAYRGAIDRIDEALLALFNQRARLAQQIGRAKTARAMPTFVPEREEEIVRRASVANAGPFDVPQVARLFRTLLEETRALEEETRRRENVGS